MKRQVLLLCTALVATTALANASDPAADLARVQDTVLCYAVSVANTAPALLNAEIARRELSCTAELTQIGQRKFHAQSAALERQRLSKVTSAASRKRPMPTMCQVAGQPMQRCDFVHAAARR